MTTGPDPNLLRHRAQLLRRLHGLAELLPLGLLTRLVADAEFFNDWNQGKKKARKSARISQFRAWEKKAEDKYWRSLNR